MKNLYKKFTFFTTVFAVALATISTASFAKDTNDVSASMIRAIAKTNHLEVRKTGKTFQKRNLGKYQTSVAIQQAKQKTAVAMKEVRLRKQSPQSSTNAFGFSIYDGKVFLVVDSDNDGFYSDFDVEMDVDVDSGLANVYGEIYYRNGNGDWQLLTTTDVFQIEGSLASDSHTVAIKLLDGFPTDSYDLLIDIYEDGFTGIVATLEAFDDADLALLPLEDVIRDSGSNSLLVDEISMDLFGDFDLDGFYNQFDLEITVDNETFGRNLQAVLYSRDSVSNWFFETETDPIWVNYGDRVNYAIRGIWDTDYPTDYYDFLIEIVDVDSGEIVADFGPEYLALFEKPMESRDYEGDDVVGGGGGSSTSLFILLLMLLGLTRPVFLKKTSVKS